MPTRLLELSDDDRVVLAAAAARWAERVESRRRVLAIEDDWRAWLSTIFADYTTHPFATHHEALWRWVWSITRGRRPRPFVAVWARGGAKSTSGEMATVALGARRRRTYVVYVSGTQDQADRHVEAIGGMLESDAVAAYYPSMAERALGKYGHSKGWRRNRLRTASGFTVDALGLDSSARGAKVDKDRPDLIILDDLDSEDDGPEQVERKILDITRKLLPAGANDLAVLAIQNLIHADSIFARLVDGRASFLTNRIVSGPVPAVRDLTYEQVAEGFAITGGEPTWAGQSLEVCQEQIDDWGLTAFLTEAQHEVEAPPGGMFDHLDWRRCSWAQIPKLARTVVWVDPSVTSTESSDSMGIQADGIDDAGTIYRLWSWERRATPLVALCMAIRKALELGAETVGVETDQGGDTWETVYHAACEQVRRDDRIRDDVRMPRFVHQKAGAGFGSKVHRTGQMLVDYERNRLVHVEGTHLTLERALRRFPRTKPFDLVDASFWSWHDLRGGGAEVVHYTDTRGRRR